MFWAVLLAAATYAYSVTALLPPAAALLAPDTAAETTAGLSGVSLLCIIAVPFACDFIDRSGNVWPVIQLFGMVSVAASLIYMLAFQLTSIYLVWIATVAASAATQIASSGICHAMVATLVMADPQRAGTTNAMFMLATSTANPIGAFAVALFPLSKASSSGGTAAEVRAHLPSAAAHVTLVRRANCMKLLAIVSSS